MASTKYPSLFLGKEMFTVESKFPSVLSILASYGKSKCKALAGVKMFSCEKMW